MKDLFKIIAVIMGFVLAIVIMTMGIVIAVDKAREPRIEACRAAGGVPINDDGININCARPDGGWIDVHG